MQKSHQDCLAAIAGIRRQRLAFLADPLAPAVVHHVILPLSSEKTTAVLPFADQFLELEIPSRLA